MCASSIVNWSFPNLFQITELQKDHVASAGVAIEKLFKNPDVETAELICEVRQSYERKCISYSRFVLFFLSLSLLDLPAGEKLHDLVALLNFDMSKVAGETLGAQSVWRHQETLQEHWSSSDVTVLPGEDVQCCLLGVTIIYFMWASLSHSLYSTTWKPVSWVLLLIDWFLFPGQLYVGTCSSSGKISYQSQDGCLMTVEHCLSWYCLW